MKKYENNVAQYLLEDNYEENYGILLRKSISTAIKLKSQSLCEKTIIGICATNHSNSCVPFIAATFLGYTVTTFDGTMCVRDTVFLLRQVTVAIMFIDEQFLPMMEESLKDLEVKFELVVFGKHDRYTTFDQYLNNIGKEDDFQPVQLENIKSTGVILFSSGTTGLAKGICLHHFGLLKRAYSIGVLQCITPESVIFYQTTLNWLTSVTLMITSILFGAARVIGPIYRGWEAIDKYKVTHISISPYLATILVKSEKHGNPKTNSVKSIWTTGTVLHPTLRKKLIEDFPKALVTQSYGQTELSGWITMFPYSDQRANCLVADEKLISVGPLVPGVSAKVVDTDTEKIVGPNERGELRLKSEYVMNGYYGRECQEAYDECGWLRTGDVVYYDEYQCFYVVGRIKEMLKFRGFQIQPAMLENILITHPAVQKAVVIGLPDDEDGDHPLGLVILNDGVYQDIDPKELELYVEERVQDRQRLRAGVRIIDSIPYTNTGKIKRTVLKDLALNGEI